MTSPRYGEPVLAMAGNLRTGWDSVPDPTFHKRDVREETRVDGIVKEVNYYTENVVVHGTKRVETRKADLRFADESQMTVNAGSLRNGNLVLVIRHRGAGGPLNDIYDLDKKEWHSVGRDVVPPIDMRLIVLVAVITCAALYALGNGNLDWAIWITAAAAVIDRLVVATRRFLLALARRRTMESIRNIVSRLDD